MKRKLLIVLMVFAALGTKAQVFNTARTLKKGAFSMGIQPTILTEGSTDFILFGHMGYGLKQGVDVGGTVGVLGPGSTYIGADIEFAMLDHFSLAGGAHVWGDFGLDMTALGTIDLVKDVDLYGGVDMDVNFNDEVHIALWIPIGVEVMIQKHIAFMLEACIGATDYAPHMISGGVNVYF